MAFAEDTDVEQALRRDLTATEDSYVDTLLDEASDLIVGYLGCDPTVSGVVPGAVTRVCARMAARVLKQGDLTPGTQQASAGPFANTFVGGSTSGSPWLAASDKQILKPYRCGGGMTSVMFRSERGYDEDESS